MSPHPTRDTNVQLPRFLVLRLGFPVRSLGHSRWGTDFVALQWVPADLIDEVQQDLTDLAECHSNAATQRLLHSHRPITMGEAELHFNELGPIISPALHVCPDGISLKLRPGSLSTRQIVQRGFNWLPVTSSQLG